MNKLLREQIHELKELIKLKDARIAMLEQRTQPQIQPGLTPYSPNLQLDFNRQPMPLQGYQFWCGTGQSTQMRLSDEFYQGCR